MDKELFLEWIERSRQYIKKERIARRFMRFDKAIILLLDVIEENIHNKKYDKNKEIFGRTNMNIEKEEINKKVDAIIDFANYQTNKLELDIVNMVRNNLDNLNDIKHELKKKITELDFIEIYIGEDEVYDWAENYYSEE